jgi:hypothetical protein
MHATVNTGVDVSKVGGKLGATLDMPTVEPLPFYVTGSAFEVDNAFCAPSADGNGHLTLIVHNHSGDWVAVSMDRIGGVSDTGHIPDGADGGFTESTRLYVQRNNTVRRWRPGVFGIPNNGGGQIEFDIFTDTLDVVVEVTVVG